MVSAVLLSLSLAAIAAPEAGPMLGVVRVVRGEVSVGRGVDLHPARSGEIIRHPAVVETDADGWIELEIVRMGRVRLSAASHLEIETNEGRLSLTLENGRAWIMCSAASGAVELVTPNARAALSPSSSVIAESARASGTALVVRAGEAWLASGTESPIPQKVVKGQIATVSTEPEATARARSGGESLVEIVALEATQSLGDLIGVKAFLLERVMKARVRGFGARGVHEIVRTDPEITGGDSGPAGAVVEGGFRPPPFFETEVPPRGPNVHVKVTYGD
jgi:hypothetical protein